MENLKENIKEIERVQKENTKISEEIKAIESKMLESYRTHTEQEILKNNERSEKTKQLREKIEINQLKIAILKNNLHYLLKMDFENSDIKQKMIDIYETKAIGEKTREKMQNDMKDFYKNNYDVKISCYISFDNFLENKAMSFNIAFLNDEGYRSFILEYNEEFKITFEKRKYNDFNLEILYYNNIVEYVEIKDLNKKAKELYKEYKKTVEKIEKLRLQQKELYHNFIDFIHGFVYNQLDIKTNLHIY